MVPLLSRMFSSKTGARISAVQTVFWVGTGEPTDKIKIIHSVFNYSDYFQQELHRYETNCSKLLLFSVFYTYLLDLKFLSSLSPCFEQHCPAESFAGL